MTGMPKVLARQLAELESASPADLRARWERAYRHPAPRRASRDLLLRALAYYIQERAERGLSKSALKRLAHLADPKGNDGRPPRLSPPRVRPGTRLVREWRGSVHHVTVGDDGFDYRGARYASLSRIAREITGTRLSGPLFFVLRKAGGRAEVTADEH